MQKTQKDRIFHEPVLKAEVLQVLAISAPLHNSGKYIDATVGFGGHLLEILKKGGVVLGMDADQEALNQATELLKAIPAEQFILVKGNFAKIDEIAKKYGFAQVEGVLYDLGVNSYQLTSFARGFSFQDDSMTLDMRIDRESNKVTASDLLNLLPGRSLIEIFLKTMPFGLSKKLADQILERREKGLIKTVSDLKEIAKKCGIDKKGKLNPLTKVFLALRIAVNSELENLNESLPKAFSLLKPGGRMVVISFHSGEDRIVKNYFRTMKNEGVARIITERPVTAGVEEVLLNPRARSAKLRVIEKI